ncbi:MAG TPA: VOC family protein [Micromonosporaceae bacterium]|nr:VOC family protein [Micromonosporaceae bacterium]
MTIAGLNHAVLFVRDAQRSAAFYREVLGFEVAHEMSGGVFLRAAGSPNDHDLALFGIGEQAGASAAGRATVGLYHLAWEVRTLGAMQEYGRRLTERGALVGASDHYSTKALYAKDPDGLEFELTWVVPPELLEGEEPATATVRPLDLAAEIARFGADRPGAATRPVPAS